MTPQINHFGKNDPCSEGLNTHLWGFEEIDGKTFIFRVNPRHVTPQIDRLGIQIPCSDYFNTLLWCFQGHRLGKHVYFSTKPRHVTPQINHFGKMIPVLRISIHSFMGFLRR